MPDRYNRVVRVLLRPTRKKGCQDQMQLSDLLSRLTPDEREIMFERRAVPTPTRSDRQSLAMHLAHPASVGHALTELNAAQMRILEWLAIQPGFQGTWSALTDALGDRVPEQIRDAYLNDLRLLALVDFHPTERGGFVATYPAATSTVPTSHRQPLHERLGAINSDVLLRICSAMGMRPAPTRKDERIQAIVQTLSDSDRCRALVARLSDAGQQLFAWMLDQAALVPIGTIQSRVARPKPGRYARQPWTPEVLWDTPEKSQLDPLTELMRCALVFPIIPGSGGWYAPIGFVIPTEVRQAFTGRGFFDAVPLMPPALDPAEGATGAIPAPTTILRDIGHLLGFIATGRCEWRQDGQPYKRSLVAFGKLIASGDQAYVDLLWELVIGIGLVNLEPPEAPDYVVRYTVRKAGEYSPDELMTQVLSAWLVRGNMTLSGGGLLFLRDNARVRLLLLLRIMPPDVWVLRSSVQKWLRFAWPLLFSPDNLGIAIEAADPGWSSLGRLILALGATPDGQEAVMLPDAHQRLLNPEASKKLPGLPRWENGWVTQPDRTIVAPPNLHPDAIANLWRVAGLESNQGAAVFRVTAASIAAALNEGMTPDEIRTTLRAKSRTALPPTVERLIDDQSARYGRIKVGAAQTFVQVDDPALMNELRRHAKLKALTWHDVAPGVAFVQGSSPNEVVDSLRKAGYLPVRAESEAKPASSKKAGASPAPPPSTIRRITKQALRDEDDLTLTWTERGRQMTETVTPIDLHPNVLHVARGDGTVEAEIPFDLIQSIEVAPYLNDDDDDDLDWDEEP